MPRVLVVDDDRDLLAACRLGLEAFGHDVRAVATGADALAAAHQRTSDVIVLDLGLPDLDGMEVCRQIRTFSEVPIIVLSADTTEDRKVTALDVGADDYMTKPFGMRELDARIRVALRHLHGGTSSAPLTVGELTLDPERYAATLSGRPLALTPKEFDFLTYLARHVGKVCTRRMILDNVWGPGYEKEIHYLKVYAYRIRRKLGDEEGHILQSDPAIGYRLVDARESTAAAAGVDGDDRAASPHPATGS